MAVEVQAEMEEEVVVGEGEAAEEVRSRSILPWIDSKGRVSHNGQRQHFVSDEESCSR